ncbi:alpha/beta hydrolase [Rhodococcus sp. NPDC003348]
MFRAGPIRAWQRHALRVGALGVSLAALVAVPVGPSGAVPDTGSIGGSSAASSDSGSVSTGSTIPGPLQRQPPAPPALRDDITTPAIVGESSRSGQYVRFVVASPALRREVGVEVLLPKDDSAPRPTIYALEGVDAPEGYSGLRDLGGAREFFADKNVNVVLTNGGVASLYSDWEQTDPTVGLHKWETFITEELPPLMDARLKTNGVKSLLGVSMGAQGAMMLAHRHPGMYRGIAVLSGCYSTMDDVGRLSVLETISSRGGDPANIWGEIGGPGWVAHDSVLGAEGLRGMEIYASAMTGVPGRHEDADSVLTDRVLIGGPIEAASNTCTRRLQSRLRELGIPATFRYEPTGVHAWPYWKDQLPDTWPTLAHSLGLSNP